MISKNQLAVTVAIQMVGAIATIFSVVIVAARFGPDGQGYWAAYRSILDFVVAIGIFGFPQSFTYAINQKKIGVQKIASFALKYVALAWPPIGGLAAMALGVGWLATSGPSTVVAGAIFIAGVLHVANGLLRGIALATTPNGWFNVMTALPQVLLLPVLAFWPITWVDGLPWAAAVSALAGFWMNYKIWQQKKYESKQGSGDSGELLISDLVTYGFWWFVAGLLTAAVPAAIYQLLLQQGNEPATVANFSIALLVLGAALLPVNMIGPILFNSLTKADELLTRQYIYVKTGRWLLLFAIGCLLIFAMIAPYVISLLFDERYQQATQLATVLLYSVPFSYYIRLSANVLTSNGAPQLYTLLVTIRLVVTFGFCILFHGSAMDYAWSLCFGEFTAALCGAMLLRRLTGWPWNSILLIQSINAERR
jgi:O-antigen/teichoic acid export membrane protein